MTSTANNNDNRLADQELEQRLLRALHGNYSYDGEGEHHDLDLPHLRQLLSAHRHVIDPHTTRLTEDLAPLIHFAWSAPAARALVQEFQVDVNATDRHGRTALHARSCDVTTCQYFITEAGADVNLCDHQGHTCKTGLFFKAIVGRDFGYLKMLFEMYPDECHVNQVTDRQENTSHYGYSLFQLAVRTNQLDMVQYLVEEQGADVNAPAFQEDRPICDAHSASMIEYLLDQGTDLTQVIDEEHDEMSILMTVLRRCIKEGNLDLTKRIMTEHNMDGDEFVASRGDTLLHYAAEHGHLDIVRFLVEECNADIHARCTSGQTPLHQTGTLQVAEYLISKHGADPNLACDNGNTVVLHWLNEQTYSSDRFEQVQWLIRHYGVDLSVKNKFGDNLLDVAEQLVEELDDAEQGERIAEYFRLLKNTLEASRDDNLESLRSLVTTQPNIDRSARSEYGNTLFLQACVAGNLAQAKFWLLEDKYSHLTEMKARNNRGETAIHLAAQSGNLHLLQWLVEQGDSDWLYNETDKAGGSVLHSACRAGKMPVIQWLVGNQEFDILDRDSNGHSALDKAIDAGHLDVMVWYNVSPIGLKRLLMTDH